MTNHCELLTEREAASTLKLSVRTLQRLVAEGRGPVRVQISSRRVGYRAGDIDSWITNLGQKAAA